MGWRGWTIGVFASMACLAVAFLSLPSTWSLLNMHWGAEPGVTILADGTTVTTTIGPKSPWPEWALHPEGAVVTVRSSALEQNGLAYGGATFESEMSAPEVQRAYARKLVENGWEANSYRIEVTPPEIAPQRALICVVDGRKGALSVRVSADDWTKAPTTGAIFWRTAPSLPLAGAAEGAC